MLDHSNEEWKPIAGYPYSVSSLGNVRRNGPKGRNLVGAPNAKGYLHVGLSGDGALKTVDIHRVVAEAFLGPCPLSHNVNHKNGIKTDNRSANLEYVLPIENARHASRLGLTKRKQTTPEELSTIAQMKAGGTSLNKIGRTFHLTADQVRRRLAKQRCMTGGS